MARGRFAAAALAASLTLTAVTAFGQAASEPDVRPEKAPPLKIVALGDSLTSGHRLSKDKAYPALLEERLDKADLEFTVVNHGVDSDTTAGGLRRLDAALAEQPQILIVELGANDGLKGVPVAQVRQNLSTIIETAQARGIAVLLVAMEALPFNGWQYSIDFHNLFPELAAKYQVPLVPFLLGSVLGNRDLMSSDGVHPNAEGTKVLAAEIFAYLKPLAASVTATRRDTR